LKQASGFGLQKPKVGQFFVTGHSPSAEINEFNAKHASII